MAKWYKLTAETAPKDGWYFLIDTSDWSHSGMKLAKWSDIGLVFAGTSELVNMDEYTRWRYLPARAHATKRNLRCILGFHRWGQYYIRPHSTYIPWHGHSRDCLELNCNRTLFNIHSPDDIDKVGYRSSDRT